ncbi:hypothetical protein B7P43_G03231 [Cryptotermes secundus]|uniref:Uncharacterized protein n=1 Tax=Cryptotermes secundus TaxID=105785 RepID=A0A2J7PTG0_9NEOP|nr:hypothetical protein B7P43_G03231 [Cryptotermes secundus]
MSLGTARLDDLRRRSSVTRLEMSPGNNNLPVLNGPDRQTGRSCRTSSLALPERSLLDLLVREQTLLQSMNVPRLPPSNQLPRRHSAHCCPSEHKPSMVLSQAPPVPLRPPAVPERSKVGPPPPITGVRFVPAEGSGLAYVKQLPISLTHHQTHPQQHQKPLQPPIPPPHISHQAKPQQAIKNISSQVPMKQKPLKPKILPTVPPQNHTIQQQPQVQPNKQQVGTFQIDQAQNHTKQSASFQTQISQSFNQSQMQQSLSQAQSPQAQNLVKQPSQMLNQCQTSQPLNRPQSQQPEQRKKQPSLPALQQTQKTQTSQNQHQPVTVPPSRADQQQQPSNNNNKVSVRQDSNVSSDSFSQNSSPSYTTKTMETPLLPHHGANSMTASQKVNRNDVNSNGNAALTKSISTPASLQTIVRFHHGSNMSLHHRIIRDMRRPSAHYITRGRLKFRFVQVLVNAVALLAIAGGLAAYFRAYPSTVRYVNKTVTTTSKVQTPSEDANPAPGTAMVRVRPELFIAACLLNARVVKPAKTTVARDRLRKHALR